MPEKDLRHNVDCDEYSWEHQLFMNGQAQYALVKLEERRCIWMRRTGNPTHGCSKIEIGICSIACDQCRDYNAQYFYQMMAYQSRYFNCFYQIHFSETIKINKQTRWFLYWWKFYGLSPFSVPPEELWLLKSPRWSIAGLNSFYSHNLENLFLLSEEQWIETLNYLGNPRHSWIVFKEFFQRKYKHL